MPTQDTSQLKEKIISILRSRGPSLPVHIAQGTELSLLFASAFLSELFSEKKIKISHMKVGNSPIYFLQEQEAKLENFAHHLKSKEKEAFSLLQERKILKDSEQEPAIRIALRAIKDFAIPFKKQDEIFWRYFTAPEDKFEEVSKKESNSEKKIEKEIPKIKEIGPLKEEEIKSELPEENVKELIENPKEEAQEKESGNALDIFEKPKTKTKKNSRKKTKKPNEKLFGKVKDFIAKENLELIDFQSFSKEDLIFKIKEEGKEKLLIAYNKKRLTETDIIKTHKKLSENSLPFIILSLGSPSKKFEELIETIKRIDKIQNLEK